MIYFGSISPTRLQKKCNQKKGGVLAIALSSADLATRTNKFYIFFIYDYGTDFSTSQISHQRILTIAQKLCCIDCDNCDCNIIIKQL